MSALTVCVLLSSLSRVGNRAGLESESPGLTIW